MSAVKIGEVYRNGDYYAEVVGVAEVADSDGEWVPAVEFAPASGGSDERYVLNEDVFIDTYDLVSDEETGEHPPEAAQMPADTRPPKATQY